MKDVIRSLINRALLGTPKRLQELEQMTERISQNIKKLEEENKEHYITIDKKITNSGYFKTAEYEIMTKIFSGAKMYLDPRDIGLVPHLVLDGDWERNITQAWLSVVKKGDVIIDVGANFGYFSVIAAQQAQGDCRISLFEANPAIISYLNKTMEVNSFSNIFDIQNVALSNTEGEVTLNILKDFIASSSIHSVSDLNKYSRNTKELELSNTVKVKAATLDKYCLDNNVKNVDLIKMDIEGYEDIAYEGMRKTVKKSKGITLFVEFSKEGYKNPKKFYNDMLEDFGFVYLIDEIGKIHLQKDKAYEKVIDQDQEWVMPIFSKRDNLASYSNVIN